MLAQRIEVVKAKNIATRQQKEKKKQLRALGKQNRVHERTARMNEFSISYSDRRAAFIDRRVAKLEKKYAIKVDNVGNSLALRLLKFRIRYAESKREKHASKLQAVMDRATFAPTHMEELKRSQELAAEKLNAEIAALSQKVKSEYEAKLANVGSSREVLRLKGKISWAEVLFAKRSSGIQKKIAAGRADSSKLEALTSNHAKKVAALESRIAAVPEKLAQQYERNMTKAGKKLSARLLQLRLVFLQKKNEKRLLKAQALLPKLVEEGNTAKTELEEFLATPSQLIDGLKQKSLPLIERDQKRALAREEKCRAKVDNRWRLKYYQLRLKYLAFFFGKRHHFLANRIQVAAIASSTGEEREQRLQIDEATSYVRWDKKIAAIRDAATLGRTAVLKDKLEKRRLDEIRALVRRKEMPPAFTLLSGARDITEIVKSTYVAGFEVRNLLNRVSSHLRRFSMYYVFAGIVIIFGAATNWTNLDPSNVANIIQNNLYILVIGLSMLLVIVSGAIDLSVGAMLGFCGTLSVYTYNLYDNLGATIIITLLVGLGYGLFQGFLIGYFKMPSFIVTLGGMLLFAGLSLFLTKGQTWTPVGNFTSDYVQWVVGTFEGPLAYDGDIHLASFFIIFAVGVLVVITIFFGRAKRAKYGIESGSIVSFFIKSLFILGLFGALGYFIGASQAGLRYYMLYLLALAMVFMIVTQNTTFGRAIYAVGGNKRAAFLSGINVARTQMLVFAVIGVTTAFASLLYTGINISASSLDGNGFELDVISSVFVGGASMTGGIGTVPGTLIGGLALGFINNGLYILNLGVDFQRIIRACILIGAVGYDIYTHRKIG